MTPETPFSLDVLGRYVCNSFEEAALSSDPAARSAAGLAARGDLRPFDFVVIGGGTFGAALAEHLWYRGKTSSTRILVLEGGPFLLPEHVQNLPMVGLSVPGPRSDRALQNEVWGLPWNAGIKFPGLAYCVGGRSVYWGGWSPRLLDEEIASWPAAVVNDLTPTNLPDGRKGYFRQASDQIGVTETNDFVFGALHDALRGQLFDGIAAGAVSDAAPLASLPDHPAVVFGAASTLSDLAALVDVDLPNPLPSAPSALAQLDRKLRDMAKLEAPLAVQSRPGHAGFFPMNKFSSVPLLIKAAREAYGESGGDDVRKRLMVVPKCHVIRLDTSGAGGTRRVTAVVTERGTIPVSPDAQVIVALGTIESTRLALASFGADGRIGTNLMAHLRSNVDIRVPRAALASLPAAAKALEVSALFVKGRHQFSKSDGSPDGAGFFHLQITASGLGAGGTNSEAELFQKIPDIDTFDAHRFATDTHVAITIRGIGGMEPRNPASNVTPDLDPRETDEFQVRRAWVNLVPSARDRELWDAMDKASDDVARIFGGGVAFEVFTPQGTKSVAPGTDLKSLLAYTPKDDPVPANRGRRDGLGTTHHEAGSLRMGVDPSDAVTDPDCRFHGVTNAFVAGPALFPTIGSPNPMLTGIALARRLGDHLMPEPPRPVAEPGFTSLFDGSDAQFAAWRMAGGGGFARFGRTIIAQPGAPGIGLLFFAARTFEDFVLRLDFLLPHPRGPGNDNSGVFVRFRDPRLPDPAPDPNDPAGNAAFVAVHTGYEIQIDEEARGDTRFGEPDGSFFNRTGAVYKARTPGTGVGQQDYRNPPPLAARTWHRCEIEVRGQKYVVRLNGQMATTFRRAPADALRGVPSSVDPNSGFIGVQVHTGAVAFANVRVGP